MSRLIEANREHRAMLEKLPFEQQRALLLKVHEILWPADNPIAGICSPERLASVADSVAAAIQQAVSEHEEREEIGEAVKRQVKPQPVTMYRTTFTAINAVIPPLCPKCGADLTAHGSCRGAYWTDCTVRSHVDPEHEEHGQEELEGEGETDYGDTYNLVAVICTACDTPIVDAEPDGPLYDQDEPDRIAVDTCPSCDPKTGLVPRSRCRGCGKEH